MSPTALTLEENVENLKYTISVYEKQIEINKKTAEEEAKNKPPAENKVEKFKKI